MKIALYFKFNRFLKTPLKSVLMHNHTVLSEMPINLNKDLKFVEINFSLTDQDFKDLTLEISTSDFNIVKHPIEIEKIILDDFYQIPSLTYRGRPFFCKKFLDYASAKNIYLDKSVTCNRLDFTGKLVYNFKWPFFRELC